ncbi:hypothetical protein [Nocardioides sp.]|jgi:hypothetical protein|uniref:hypothetical protein n=1 Tax=Nocardioides sp. TaxID=35761 RepID=UPI0031FE88F6|nr:hypothetical protein [Nocardioides sp.]
MRLRTVGAGLALALAGVAGGFVVGNVLQSDPASIAAVTPVPAQSPSYPVTEYDVLPDPAIAPLGTDLPSHEASFRLNQFRLQASVPDGWRRVTLVGGSAWNFAPPDNPLNSYVLRIEIVAGSRSSVSAAKGFRILKLQNAVDDGNLQHLVIEQDLNDGFEATYLDPGLVKGTFYQRVTMERWLTFGDSATAYADVAVTGREADRAGLADLLERVVDSARIP